MGLYTKEDRGFFTKLHLITGLSYADCRRLIEGLVTIVVMDHNDHRATKIPLIGTVEVNHVSDEMTSRGCEAVLDSSIEISDFIRRVVGQLSDKEISDLGALWEKNIESVLRKFKDDESINQTMVTQYE